MHLHLVNVFAGIAFDNTIRGLLVVLVGVVVLMGSIYMILATNTGNRLGFLIALTGLFGWMAIMGTMWWMYGIGMKGTDPSWKVVEINTGQLDEAGTAQANQISTDDLPSPKALNELTGDAYIKKAEELDKTLGGGWELLALSDKARGEAQAKVDEALPETDLPFQINAWSEDGSTQGLRDIESSADYATLYAFQKGGKPRLDPHPDRWERISEWASNAVHLKHPPHYAVIQVQPVKQVKPVEGEAPPTPVADESQPVVSVIMVRSLGDRRFPSFMIMVGSLLLFGLLCYLLHTRDRRVQEHLAIAAAT